MNGTANYKPEKTSFRAYLHMFKGIPVPWLFILLIFVATLVSTFAGMFVTVFTGDMVDAQGNVPTAQLVRFALGYLLMAVAAAGSTVFSGVASERINLGLRRKLWRKMIYTCPSAYDSDGGETLVSRVTTDCDYASKLLTTLVGFVSLAISLVMYVFQMYALNMTLSNWFMILIPFSVLIGWGYARLKFLIAQKTQAMLSRSTTYLAERTANLSLIKTANAQEQEMQAGKDYFQQQYIMQIKTGLMTSLFTSLQTLYSIVSVLIPFAVGAGLVARGLLSVGDVVTFYGLSGMVGTSFTNVIDSVGTIRQSNGALARVIHTMALPDEQVETGRQMDEPDADLVFEDVDFAYGETPVLQQISCRIPKHQVTAVIGANGSGKSTLFKLAERLYEPDKGTLRFGDTDAKSYNLHSWRKAICTVAQGSPLLEGTIRENICYGCRREISQQELETVARLSHVWDFVQQLPDQFETRITANGQNLSGGQRQCIAIARAMMNRPDYLLLDEATSNLDAASENQIMEAFDSLMEGRTTVIIAHSLSTIRRADHVIVLRDGKVESEGSPAEVLRQSDNYLACVINRCCPIPTEEMSEQED